MRRLPLLACLALPLAVQAEDSAPEQPPPAAVEVIDAASTSAHSDLERRLAESEQQRQALAAQLATQSTDQDNSQDDAVIGRLRQENQRLKLQLREAQSQQPPRLLNEQQTWYAVGGATAVLAFLLGALSRGSRRRQRREWIN
ncbi:translation initiation factor 2 (IF-2, GTPase) [Pseudomonas sp. LA21]|uniref:translation initiation factor 2 (IF-2, GTPase) n=1 Tax=unclassified Pseudomonas TaxID=196821 RepID=UPI001FB73737|nr:translation initiation factor 2 (IF-2, GTPase) [Pseudomonas sp. LA21]MCJ1887856.1 translation initiation factor 2 (IF-2, GTPase) [Pseudomonas sp. LA21]